MKKFFFLWFQHVNNNPKFNINAGHVLIAFKEIFLMRNLLFRIFLSEWKPISRTILYRKIP